MRGRDDRDDAGKKAAAGALATLTSASNKTCKKVIEAKQWNDGQPNMLTDTKDEIVMKNTTGIQDKVNTCKRWQGRLGRHRRKRADLRMKIP